MISTHCRSIARACFLVLFLELRCVPNHNLGSYRHPLIKIDDVRRRAPIGPLDLAHDLYKPSPLKAVASDADAVADGATISLDQVQVALRRVDDDGSGRLGRPEENDLLLIRALEHFFIGGRL